MYTDAIFIVMQNDIKGIYSTNVNNQATKGPWRLTIVSTKYHIDGVPTAFVPLLSDWRAVCRNNMTVYFVGSHWIHQMRGKKDISTSHWNHADPQIYKWFALCCDLLWFDTRGIIYLCIFSRYFADSVYILSKVALGTWAHAQQKFFICWWYDENVTKHSKTVFSGPKLKSSCCFKNVDREARLFIKINARCRHCNYSQI